MNTITRQHRWPALRGGWRQIGLCALLAGAAAAAAAAAPGAAVRSDKVELSYRDSASFTEMKLNPLERTDWLDDLSRYVVSRGSRVLPEGERLSITITDVERAGRFERLRPNSLSDVRIVRHSTPPRIALSFRLESAQGAVLKQGERELRDINFLPGRLRYRGEPLVYEKNLIDAWLRKEFGQAQP